MSFMVLEYRDVIEEIRSTGAIPPTHDKNINLEYVVDQ